MSKATEILVYAGLVSAFVGGCGYLLWENDQQKQNLRDNFGSATQYANQTAVLIQKDPTVSLQPKFIDSSRGYKIKFEFDKIIPVRLENEYPKATYSCRSVQITTTAFTRLHVSDTVHSEPYDCKPV